MHSSQTKPHPHTPSQMALMVPKAICFSFLTVVRGRGLGDVGPHVLLVPQKLEEQQEEAAGTAQ